MVTNNRVSPAGYMVYCKVTGKLPGISQIKPWTAEDTGTAEYMPKRRGILEYNYSE